MATTSLPRIHFLAALTVCSALILTEIEYLPHAYVATDPPVLSYIIIVANALAKWSTFSCVFVSLFTIYYSITRNLQTLDVTGGFAFFVLGMAGMIVQELLWFSAHMLDLYTTEIVGDLQGIHNPTTNGQKYYVTYMVPAILVTCTALAWMVRITTTSGGTVSM